MTSPAVDETGSKLLELLQESFPVAVDPWSELGAKLGLTAEETLARVRALKEAGLLRRIGPVFNPAGMGFKSALFALRTLPEKEEATAAFLCRYDGITHNYKRDCDLNIWFTLVAESEARMGEILDEIRRACEPLCLLRLDAEKTYKIKGTFHVGAGRGGHHAG